MSTQVIVLGVLYLRFKRHKDEEREERRRTTTLVIAHRLSTIVGANKICVLENGKLAEMGTHEELLGKKHGKYAALFKRQQEAA